MLKKLTVTHGAVGIAASEWLDLRQVDPTEPLTFDDPTTGEIWEILPNFEVKEHNIGPCLGIATYGGPPIAFFAAIVLEALADVDPQAASPDIDKLVETLAALGTPRVTQVHTLTIYSWPTIETKGF